MDQSKDDRIRARAYELWERDGGRHGDDWSYWLQAEREVTLEDTPPSAQETATAKAKAAADPFPKKAPAARKPAAPKAAAPKPAAPKAGAAKKSDDKKPAAAKPRKAPAAKPAAASKAAPKG